MKLRYHTTPHNLFYLSLICGRFWIFLFIMCTIKNFAFTLGVIVVCLTHKYEVPVLTFRPSISDLWVNMLLFSHAQCYSPDHFLGRNLNVSSNMGVTHSITWLWLHSDAVSSYFLCMAAVSAVLSGCCIFSSFCSREGQQISEGMWGQW